MSKKNKKMTKPSPAVTHFPSPILQENPVQSDEEKMHLIAEHFQKIMEILGINLTNHSLAKTPQRVAKMYVKEIFSGLNENNFPNISFFEEEEYSENKTRFVFIKVSFTSFCEHHFVPISGYAYVAYIPKDKVIGLSDIPRLVHFFARRPQLQERLTAQIADSLALLLDHHDVAVSIHAKHFCVIARGTRDENSRMITNVLRGQFNSDEKFRYEFFEAINRQDLD